MERRKNLTLLRLVLALAAVFWVVGQCLAQTDTIPRQQAPAQRKITDAAGRVHTIMNMRNITPAQRLAAAQRAQKTRAAAVAQQKLGASTSQGEVKQ